MSESRSESPIEAQFVAPPESTHPTSDINTGKTTSTEIIQSRGAVFAILFLVTGVFGIPLLWMNRNFSNPERIVWSIIVTIYTAALVWFTVLIVLWSYRQIMG